MGDKQEKESIERSKRIVDHMNADHQHLLPLFLEVYCLVPRSIAQSAKMEDVSLTELVIRANRTRYRVPFEPPLSSLDDVKQRVIDMRDHCLKTLGISDIVIKEYQPPTGSHAVLFIICLTTFIAFSRRSNFLPGSMLYSLVLRQVPRFAVFCYTIQPLLLSTMVVIHLSEATHLAVKRLRPHRVPFFSRLWWCWVIDDFITGFTALLRFDALVRKERNKREKHRPSL
ncbi:hypothetical protein VTN77DRAFT_4292 [Rasamsonia byssochlamydoides]|uniref:uncharacterized protein n=1 Tax=Rasamsonia byssochlamydoides TaxID=89139 RepID=UPI0037447307